MKSDTTPPLVTLHQNPAKHWLIQSLLDSAPYGVLMHDDQMHTQFKTQFPDPQWSFLALIDELYRQGIVCIRGAQWVYLSDMTRTLLNNCIAESRTPIWDGGDNFS